MDVIYSDLRNSFARSSILVSNKLDCESLAFIGSAIWLFAYYKYLKDLICVHSVGGLCTLLKIIHLCQIIQWIFNIYGSVEFSFDKICLNFSFWKEFVFSFAVLCVILIS